MMDDTGLLRRFVRDHDEAAFAELVRRHIDWTYSAAMRQLNGDAHLACDAVQIVFTDLARKAAQLERHSRLGGWLFTTTRFVTARLVRSERRRRAREQEASAMQDARSDSPDLTDWDRLRPVLDDALAELSSDYRDAVLLRYFENHEYATIGARFEIPANTARMRVERALDKLHAALARRGISSTSAAIATALGAHAVGAAPAGLATTVTATALASGAAVGGGALATFLAMSKLPLGLTAAIVVGGATTLLVQHETGSTLRAEIGQLRTATMERRMPIAQPAAAELEPPWPASADPALDRAYESLAQEATNLATRLAALDRATARALGRVPLQGEVHKLADLTTKPAPLRRVPPEYPLSLKMAGVTGNAVIGFTVDAAGRVQDLNAVSATHEAFAKAAMEALAQWEFMPGQIEGVAVHTRMQQPMVFNISNETPPIHEWF